MSFMHIDLKDYSLAAMTGDALPSVPPELSSWPDNRQLILDGGAWTIFAEVLSISSTLPTGIGGGSPQSRGWLGVAIPNPFNPRTTFPFRLERAGYATLTIYDVRGRPIRDLIGDWMPAGTYEIAWDGRDSAGNVAASGTYFCRLVLEGRSMVRKLTLLK